MAEMIFRGWPKGMNNRARDHELKSDELRNAVNVDITDDGKVVSRPDKELAVAGSDCHSLWANGDVGYYIDGTELKKLTISDAGVISTATVVTGMTAGRRCAFEEVDRIVYYSNGVQRGKLVDGVRKDWGVEMPASAPSVMATSSGLLSAGRYKIAVVFLAGEEESGVTFVTPFAVLNDGEALQLTGLPQPTGSEVTGIRIYVSQPDGELLFHQADLPVGTASYVIYSVSDQGKQLATQFKSPPPAGDLLAYYRGRIYIAAGKVVYYTEPLAYGLFDWRKNFLIFGEEVSVVLPVDDGLYIAADKTYFYAGTGPEDFAPREVLPYGAVKYSGAKDTENKVVFWFSHRGLVVAGPGGQVQNVQQDRVAVDAYVEGASFVRELEGLRQVVAVLSRRKTASGLAVSDYADAEVRRKTS